MLIDVLEFIFWSCIAYVLTFGLGDQILAWHVRRRARHAKTRDGTEPPTDPTTRTEDKPE